MFCCCPRVEVDGTAAVAVVEAADVVGTAAEAAGVVGTAAVVEWVDSAVSNG